MMSWICSSDGGRQDMHTEFWWGNWLESSVRKLVCEDRWWMELAQDHVLLQAVLNLQILPEG
jgi:hypothetical protein